MSRKLAEDMTKTNRKQIGRPQSQQKTHAAKIGEESSVVLLHPKKSLFQIGQSLTNFSGGDDRIYDMVSKSCE
jgi:hypothetical protein